MPRVTGDDIALAVRTALSRCECRPHKRILVLQPAGLGQARCPVVSEPDGDWIHHLEPMIQLISDGSGVVRMVPTFGDDVGARPGNGRLTGNALGGWHNWGGGGRPSVVSPRVLGWW